MSTSTPNPYSPGQRVMRGYSGDVGTVTSAVGDRVSVTLDNGGTDSGPAHFRTYRVLPAVDSLYRDETPAAQPDDAHWTDTVVCQGHADYCAAWGHATGADRCPRCGDVLPREAWTPAMVATLEDGEVMVRWLASGDYVASGSDRASATEALRSFGVSPESVDWSPLEAPAPAVEYYRPGKGDRAYTFYVGSVDFYDAHTGSAAAYAFPKPMRGDVHARRECVYGIWEGEREEVALYRAFLADDATAQRIAYAIAIATGNDAVLVTRERSATDYGVMCANNRFIARMVLATDGDRTLYNMTNDIVKDLGSRLVPDVTGFHVAFLVNADASVSAVS